MCWAHRRQADNSDRLFAASCLNYERQIPKEEFVLRRRSLLLLRMIVMCTGLTALPAAVHAQSLAPRTTWINDHARFVIESIDPDGKLSGTYENFGANFMCAGQVFPVTGWTDGERISYAVRRKNPGNCSSVQGWTGYVHDGELLVEFAAAFADGRQDVVPKGADRYRRQ
jgi:Avidin family